MNKKFGIATANFFNSPELEILGVAFHYHPDDMEPRCPLRAGLVLKFVGWSFFIGIVNADAKIHLS